MTEGSSLRHLLLFSLPLIWGNLFQMTYNAADSMMIGRFAGESALAAVGAAEPIMNFLILAVSGFCIGAGVMISHAYGADDHKRLRRVFGLSIRLAFYFSAAVVLIGLIGSRAILSLMQTPSEIIGASSLYLGIILIGMPATSLYNVLAAAMRGVGNSKGPILCLAAASVINIILDYMLIAVLQWGAGGAAAATVISQWLSVLFCVHLISKRMPLLHISKSDLGPDRALMLKTLQYGGFSALQQCAQPIGKLFIQGMVNTLGVSVIAVFNAVGRIEDIALLPERSIGSAMMTFTAQNLGANKRDRVKKGLKTGLMLEFGWFLIILTLIALLHRPLLTLFGDDAAFLKEGSRYFSVMIWFYWLPGMTNGVQGFFRGIGHMKVTLALSLTQIGLRTLLTFVLIPALGITGIAYACAGGWIVMLLVGALYADSFRLRKKALY